MSLAWISRRSVGAKLALPALTSLAFMILAAAAGIWGMTMLHNIIADMYEVRLTRFLTAAEIKQEATAVNGSVYTIIAWTASEYDPKKIAELAKAQGPRLDKLIAATEATGQKAQDASEAALFIEVNKGLRTYKEAATSAIDMLDQGLSYATMYFGKADAAYIRLDEALTTLTKAQQERVKEQYLQAGETLTNYRLLYAGVSLAALVACITLLIAVRQALVGSASSIRSAASQLQSGDLRQRVGALNDDEIGQAGDAFNGLIDRIQALVRNVQVSVNDTTEASRAINHAAANLAGNARDQASDAANATTTVNQMNQQVSQVAELTHRAAEHSDSAGEQCDTASAMMTQVSDRMQVLSSSVGEAASLVRHLDQKSTEVTGIALDIKDIADQTNLLALNAAIEAARAGENGRGFAVVADEVRRLAERTRDATHRISELLDAVRADTNQAAVQMESGNRDLDDCVTMVHEAASAMAKIQSQTAGIVVLTRDIAATMRQQKVATGDIAGTVARMAEMASTNVNASTHTMQEAEQLQHSSEKLQEAICAFKV